MNYVGIVIDYLSYIGLVGMAIFVIYCFFEKDIKVGQDAIKSKSSSSPKETKAPSVTSEQGARAAPSDLVASFEAASAPNNGDPFNCPLCGSHDYGLYIVPFGECVWCMKRERDTLLAEEQASSEYMIGILAACEEEKAKFQRKIDGLQAKIDALMFEYCSDEMTPEQKARWAEHQVPGNG
jgi:hypothetical protein